MTKFYMVARQSIQPITGEYDDIFLSALNGLLCSPIICLEGNILDYEPEYILSLVPEFEKSYYKTHQPDLTIVHVE